ncbi:uncharacterized protein BDR25DRAFT_314381 [Lindgomyces ingoldianus]|uniref:Uncharacterized protein n=1 Tax=Lindgomyces ingoldianus TaxID=673940 RepID=A0ACB6QUL8_9PLEO|nr:uncharacterized protein BDR25DRAFT_314381 [Lindgomyces ingoldianus]KAF2470684.1 hypothetical protein BDR25DRAFT_314381 [Lindgomyces ingoldianus]
MSPILSWQARTKPKPKKPRYYATALTEDDKFDLAGGVNTREWAAEDMIKFEESRKDLEPDPHKEMEGFPPGCPEHEAAKFKLQRLAVLEEEYTRKTQASNSGNYLPPKDARASTSPASPDSQNPLRESLQPMGLPTYSVPISSLSMNEPVNHCSSRGTDVQQITHLRASSSPISPVSPLSLGEPREPLHFRTGSAGDYFSQPGNRVSAQLFPGYLASQQFSPSHESPREIRRAVSGDGNLSRSNARYTSQHNRIPSRIRSPLANEVTFRVNPHVTFDSFVVQHASGKGEAYRGAVNAAMKEEVETNTKAGGGVTTQSSKCVSKIASIPTLKVKKIRNAEVGLSKSVDSQSLSNSDAHRERIAPVRICW